MDPPWVPGSWVMGAPGSELIEKKTKTFKLSTPNEAKLSGWRPNIDHIGQRGHIGPIIAPKRPERPSRPNRPNREAKQTK